MIPDMDHDVFISYSSIDKKAADTICSILEEKGISCWMAPRNITPGVPFSEAIIDGIKSSKIFVLVYTANSNDSSQVIREVDRAAHNGLSIINLRLEDVPLSKQLEYYLSSVHWLDAMALPMEQYIHQLCNVVQIFLKPEEVKDIEIAKAIKEGIINQREPAVITKGSGKQKRKTLLISASLLLATVIIVSLIIFGITGGGKQARAGSVESIVVLPFGNYTGTSELESLVSGMHACLISDMGRLSGLRVINTTTSNVYKNAGMSVHEIALELNVDAAIEVSVLGIHDSIIIHVSLIRASTEEETIWTANYKEEKSQLMNLYNRITSQIADEVKIKLTPGEKRLLAESRTVDPEALVAYMKGQFHWERLGTDDLDSALYYFQVAIDKGPEWAEPYAGMAMTWNAIGGFAYGPLDEAYKKTTEYMNIALELDPNSAYSHYIKAILSVWPGWDWETGEKEFLKTLDLNPNDALCRIYYAHLLMILRRFDEAVYQANLALALDPLRPLVLGLYAVVMNRTGDHQSALTQAEKALSIDPGNNFAISHLAKAYLATGDTLKWHETMKKRWSWADKEYLEYLDTVFQEGGYLAVIRDRIRINEEVYGEGGNISFTGQAERYLIIGNYEKAMDYFEKAYNERLWTLAYISQLVLDYPELKKNPRYIALLKKMNLPL